VDLAITPDTQFQVPGKEEDSFADIAVGSRVAVLATAESGAQRALKVMLLPGRPQRVHRVLTVTEVSGKTVVAEDAEGNRIEVELEHEPTADIKGQLVTFIGTESQQSNRFKANVEVKIAQIVKRLETQARQLDTEVKGEADATIKARKEKQLADLEALLEANMQRHLDRFAEIIAKAPPQAKASLEAALQATLQGYKAALEGMGEAKADVKERLELRTLHGTVEAINLSTGPGSTPSIGSGQGTPAGEITVKSLGDAEVTLKLSSDTEVFLGQELSQGSEISVGDRVRVSYNKDNMVAAKIQVQEADSY
jgi:citrate lyase gamma subunit